MKISWFIFFLLQGVHVYVYVLISCGLSRWGYQSLRHGNSCRVFIYSGVGRINQVQILFRSISPWLCLKLPDSSQFFYSPFSHALLLRKALSSTQVYLLIKCFNFKFLKVIGSRAHVLINFHNKTFTFMSYVYLDGNVIVRRKKKRENIW